MTGSTLYSRQMHQQGLRIQAFFHSRYVVLVLLEASSCASEKLTPGQKAPAFAKGSGGLALKAPYEGGAQAADVGRRGNQAIPGPPAPASSGGSTQQQVDGVMREETEELKEVDGKLVRVVKGSFAYDSPEGLPIAVKYVADENGNRASFTFGTGKPSSGAGASRPSGGANKKPGLTPGGPSATSLGGAGRETTGSGGKKTGGGRPPGQTSGGASGQGGASTYLPPTTTKVDRSYLPPN